MAVTFFSLKEGDSDAAVILTNEAMVRTFLTNEDYDEIDGRLDLLEENGGGSGESGNDGLSPTAKVEQTESGAVITITDKNGTTTAVVSNGEDGYTPVKGKDYFDGVKGDTGPAGAAGKNGNGIKSVVLNANYTLTLTFDDGTSYTTPSIRGATGSAGKDGAPGQNGAAGVGIASIKQTTTSTADDGINVFTVTLTNGTTATFTVQNGSKGSTGETGAAGKDGTSVTVANISETVADGGKNVVTFSDGKSLTVMNGKTGSTGNNGLSIFGINNKPQENPDGQLEFAGTPILNERNVQAGDIILSYLNNNLYKVTSVLSEAVAVELVGNIQGDTGPQGPAGADGAKGDTGSTGATGERGTGLLKITTATTSASGTGTTGAAIKYKIALATVKSEAGVDKVLVGDIVSRSYYLYPVVMVDTNYVYLGAYTSIRGATGAAGATPVKGTDYFTEADKSEMVAAVTAAAPTITLTGVDADGVSHSWVFHGEAI